MFDLLTDWMINSLIDWFIDFLPDWIIDSRHENLTLALSSAQSIGVNLVNIDANDLIKGTQHLVLGIHSFIHSFIHHSSNSFILLSILTRESEVYATVWICCLYYISFLRCVLIGRSFNQSEKGGLNSDQ